MTGASPEDLNKLKLAELKKLCKDNGIPVSGTRAELIARLLIRQDSGSGSDVQLQPEDEAVLLGDIEDVSGGFSQGDEESVLLSSGEKRKAPAPLNTSQTSLDGVKDILDSPTLSSAPPASKKVKQSVDQTKKPLEKSITPITAPEKSNDATTANKDSVTLASNKVVGQCVSSLEEKQRIEARAARFAIITAPSASETSSSEKLNASQAVKENTDSAADRLAARAKRFGLTNGSSGSVGGSNTPSSGSWDKKTAKAMRSAGEAFSAEARGSVGNVEKLKERANRFGITTSRVLEQASESEKLAKRAEKFGIDGATATSPTESKDEDEKKKVARLERFGADSVSKTSTMTDAEKAAKRLERFGGASATKVA